MLMLSRLKFEIAPLVEQMLDQLPSHVWTDPNITFLDPGMAGGQFLIAIQKRLQAAGHSNENIAGRMYGCEENILRVNYAKNNKKLVTTNLYVTEFLKHDWGNMKFDVIVGNPPYQSTESKRIKLWFSFLEKSFEILDANGHLAMITPNSWMNQDTTVAVQCRELFKNKRLMWLNKNVDSYFSVGETTCAFVISNSGTPVYDGSKIFENSDQSLENDICQKMKNAGLDPAKTVLKRLYSSPHPSQNSSFKARPTKLFSNPVVHSSTETWFTNIDVDHLKGHNVIINNSGYYYHKSHPTKYIFYSDTHVAGGNAFQITFKNKKHATNALSFLTSKLYRFFVDKTKSGGFNATALYQIPMLDTNKKWSDDEVFKFFALSTNEIAMVESHCD